MIKQTLLCAMLVLGVSTSLWAGPRSLVGIGFPTTDNPGGDPITGTIDWGTPETLPTADYSIDFGASSYTGTFSLLATTIAGSAAQLVYSDPLNDLTFTAISANGPFSLDPVSYSDAGGYGGFEAWTLTDTGGATNRYGSITSIVDVNEPAAGVLAVFGAIGLCVFGYRRNARSY